MLAYLKILRPSVILLAVFAVIVGAVLSGFWDYYSIGVAALVALLVCGGGNVINDIFDYQIDKINKPKRPLPSGKIKMNVAKVYAASLFVVAFFLSVLFLNTSQLVLVLINMVVALVYSWKLKALPLIGNLFPSWLAASSFLFGGLFVGINATVLLLFLMAFFANTGREIAKTIEDMPGDKKAGYKTLPLLLGKNFAAGVTILFVVFAVMLSPLPWALGLLSINYLYVVFIADVAFAIACWALLLNASRGQFIMKIAMIISIFAFLSSLI